MHNTVVSYKTVQSFCSNVVVQNVNVIFSSAYEIVCFKKHNYLLPTKCFMLEISPFTSPSSSSLSLSSSTSPPPSSSSLYYHHHYHYHQLRHHHHHHYRHHLSFIFNFFDIKCLFVNFVYEFTCVLFNCVFIFIYCL